MWTRLEQYTARWRSWFAPVSPPEEPESPEEVMGQSLWLRLQKWRAPLLAFVVGQPAVQILNLLTGFFLIRWLDVEQYAMFGIAFAFQSTVTQWVDLGFSGSIVALAGHRSHDPEILGAYIRAARHWRSKTQFAMLLFAAVAFPLLTWNQPWSIEIKALLFLAIVLGVVFQGWIMYGAALLVHRALAQYYRPQIVGAALRLVFSAALYWIGALQAWQAAVLGAMTIGYNGLSYKRASRPYVREPDQSDPARHAEMLKYLSPLIPGVVFVALQGQILVAMSTIFGSTRNIAEVSALGRIGQLFVILSAFNSVIVEPYVARISRDILLRRYLQILAAAACLSAFIAGLAFLFPEPLLWLLGNKYANLHAEVGWVVFTACLNYLGGVMWTMHAARRWVFWWGTAAYISSLLVVQTLCIATMDLSKTLLVIYFGLASTMIVMLVHVATAVFGFRLPDESAAGSKMVSH